MPPQHPRIDFLELKQKKIPTGCLKKKWVLANMDMVDMMFLFCWFIILFWSFLSKTKRVWPFAGHVHGEFFLCTLHNSLMKFFTIFRVKIRALLQPNIRSWTEFDLPIIWGVKFWWFSFFYFPSMPTTTRISPLWKITRNWQNLRNQWEPTPSWGRFLKCHQFLVNL